MEHVRAFPLLSWFTVIALVAALLVPGAGGQVLAGGGVLPGALEVEAGWFDAGGVAAAGSSAATWVTVQFNGHVLVLEDSTTWWAVAVYGVTLPCPVELGDAELDALAAPSAALFSVFGPPPGTAHRVHLTTTLYHLVGNVWVPVVYETTPQHSQESLGAMLQRHLGALEEGLAEGGVVTPPSGDGGS